MIEWMWPWIALLLPLPWLVRKISPSATSSEPALRAPFYDDWQKLNETHGGKALQQGLLPSISLWVLWGLLLIATARPIWIGEASELPNNGRDLMLAVDRSGSMRVEDMQLGQHIFQRVDVVK